MRALTMDELEYVSGGLSFSGESYSLNDLNPETVVVPGNRRRYYEDNGQNLTVIDCIASPEACMGLMQKALQHDAICSALVSVQEVANNRVDHDEAGVKIGEGMVAAGGAAAALSGATGPAAPFVAASGGALAIGGGIWIGLNGLASAGDSQKKNYFNSQAAQLGCPVLN